ncbi:MAG: choice-of-anchor J domain-containing protein [Saprospiraceae bacterium]|nr:choice-of-anchor J domain-containing protein [Saprospiraceae bacterium]
MLKKLLFAVAMVVFATAMNAQTVIWEENFDAGTTFPAGWSQQTNASDGGWKIGTNAVLSSSSFPIPNNSSGNIVATNDDACNCNKANDILITPTLDLTAYADSTLFLTYDMFYAKLSYQGIIEGLEIVASVNGGAWTSLKEMRGRTFWVRPSGVDVSAYAGMAEVRFGFKYTDNNGWLYGAAIDNVKLVIADNVVKTNVSGVGISRYLDVVPTYFDYAKFWTGGEMFITGTVSNSGFVPVTSFDLEISNGTNTTTETITVDLPFDEFYEFQVPYTVEAGMNEVVAKALNINGLGDDDDPTDNEDMASVEGVTPVEGRKVVGEEATGTWCQWCPRGAVMMDFMTAEYPNFIGVAVHNGDPMVVGAYDAAVSAQVGGYPGGLMDRAFGDVDPIEFEDYFINRMAQEPVVSINQNVDWDDATRTVTVSSYFKFLQEMNGDFRVAVVFTEDGVTGTAANYAQKNAYSGGGAGPMGGYENLPATIPASQMVYDHVARAIVGGFGGAANSAPPTNPEGTVFSYENTYVVPNAYDVTAMHAITMLINNATGEILNAEQTDVPNVFVGTNNVNDMVSVKMFPNPVVDEATIKLRLAEASDIQVRIVDAYGKVVVDRNYANVSGEQYLPFRVGTLPMGTYMLTVTAKGQSVTKPFVIAR